MCVTLALCQTLLDRFTVLPPPATPGDFKGYQKNIRTCNEKLNRAVHTLLGTDEWDEADHVLIRGRVAAEVAVADRVDLPAAWRQPFAWPEQETPPTNGGRLRRIRARP